METRNCKENTIAKKDLNVYWAENMDEVFEYVRKLENLLSLCVGRNLWPERPKCMKEKEDAKTDPAP